MKTQTVVIVEDDFFIAEANRCICESVGLEVVDACDTQDGAISSIASNDPDFVLLDVNLRDNGDGITVARTAFEQGFKGNVIFATGSMDPATLHRIRATPHHGLVIKPFDETDIAGLLAATG